MSCIINSPFDGKPSVTHKKLMDYFGDTEEGIIKANTEYARLTSPEFLQRFHGPNEPHWTVMNDSNVTDRSRFTEQFEPMLFEHPSTGELYYKRYDGSRDWVQGKPLAWLSNKAKRQMVDAIIFDSFAGQDGLMETDFEADFELAIEDTLQGYKEMFEGTGMDLSNADLAFLRDEIQKVLKARQLVLKDSIDQNRDSYTEVDEEMGEDDLDELEEGRTSNDVVRKESYFKNSKDTASANIKFMLSFIPNIKSFGVENGELVLEYADNELSQELGEPFESYTDPDRLWRKLESNLSDIFSTVDYEGNLISVLDKMKTRMANMAKTDPAIAYVNYYVFGGEGNAGFPEYKRIQFAQAFFKHNIVFSTTDVSGNEPNFKYRVIDPTVATSKAGKIRNAWAQTLKQSPFFKVTEDEATGLNRYTIDKETVKKAEEKIQERILELGDRIKKNNVAQNTLTEYFTSLNNIFKYIGIPTEVFTEETWQMLLQDVEAERGTPVNYAQFLRFLMNESLIAVKAIRKTQDRNINKNGQFASPISSSAIYKRISNVLAVSSDEIGESTVFMPGGKTAWTYSMPSYIDIKLNAYKNSFYELTDTFGNTYTRNKMIDDLQASSPYYRTPVFDMLHDKANANMFRSSIFSGFQRQGNSKYGKDNKNIAYADQLVDKVTKALLPRIEANAVTVHYSPAAADKGRLAQLQGIPLYRVTTENGRLSMDVNEALDIIVRNIEAEYLRSKDAYQVAVSTDKSQLTVHYHLKEMVDPYTKESVFTALNKKNLPVGNAIQIQSAPSLSPYEVSGKALDQVDFLNNIPGGEIRKLLYKVDEQNNKVEYLLSTFDTLTPDGTSVRDLVKQYIANNGLQQRIETAIQEFKQNGIVSDDGTTLKNLKLDERLWKHYYSRYSENEKNLTYEEKQLALYDLVAEYTLNGMIAVDAYNKLFAGDVAYYKDSIDYNKRIPATYTDGKYLIINDKSELSFNTAVIENVKVSATDLEQMKSDFEISIRAQVELMDEETKAKYTDEYISALAEGYADQYNSVNSTDAQGWISLDRWKFLKTKTDGWSPALDAAYERLKNGTFTHEDLKFAAQPLKGVYFERNQVNGVPTYLKYSQAVLIPSVVKGTQLEYLVNAMEKQNVDEMITLDGVKVGALMPTKIHDDNGNLLKDIKFNVMPLSNLHWKLQQQLPVKGMKENMDLGSQPMKNILSNIFDNGMYGNRTGAEIKDLINSTISDLVMIAFDETVSKLGLDYDGNIVDKPKFYDTLSKLALDKNVPQFAIEALERNYSIDAIPQLRYKIQNIISAQFNNNIAKTITPGGSFIQISNFGVTKQDLDSKTGIYMLKDVSALERPKIRKGEDGKFKVSSGQVFLPHSFIAKYIPDYRELTVEQLKEKISPELFKLIGYRIPNQKLSSNQPLEVVGILPESMGDSIMMYTEITTQTGSDFDIDKTYVMMPAFNVEYSNRKDIVDTLFKMEDTKLLSFREDLEDYREYLNENPLPQDKVNNPGSNKRKLIDYLLDRGLVPSDITKKYVKGLRYVRPKYNNNQEILPKSDLKSNQENINKELLNKVNETLSKRNDESTFKYNNEWQRFINVQYSKFKNKEITEKELYEKTVEKLIRRKGDLVTGIPIKNLPAFHGSFQKLEGDIDISKSGLELGEDGDVNYKKGVKYNKPAIFASSSKEIAETYTKNDFGKAVGELNEVLVNFNNPLVIDAQNMSMTSDVLIGITIDYASSNGYDGIVVKGINDSKDEDWDLGVAYTYISLTKDGIKVNNQILTEESVYEALGFSQESNNISTFTNYSGGAQGGDTIWENIGKEFGLGKQVNYRPEDLNKLTKEQLQEVENAYQQAVKDLGRKPLSSNTFAGGLVRRDYLQAKAADAVFAISTIVEPGQKDPKGYINKTNKSLVAGGTGYAVQMAINLGKPVYVFDQNKNEWFVWDNNTFKKTDTPILTSKFAGIGTREINENGKQAIRNVYEKTTQYQKEFVKQVETTEISTPRVPRVNKKALQNALFEAYYDILTSPLSYVDMMSGIDGSELKDDINSLHGKKAKLTDFELLDPTYQLRIKFDNIVGKSGVGLTANQMGDHVYGQLAGLRMVASEVSTILGNYAYTDGGEIDLSKMFDKSGKKILDTISMFLNAYVDIAKDPYITKGNFNVHTSNSAFFLIRAGMPLNHIIRFIGQPILKDTIKLYESTLSTLPSTANKRSTLVDSAKKALSTMQNKAKNVRRRKINDSVDAAVKNLSFTPRPTEMLSPAVLERMIRNADEHLGFLDIMENGTEAEIMRMYQENPDEFIRKYQDSINFVSMQSGVLDNFLAIHTAGEQLSEQVLASKADVNGGGHDIAQHFVNNQKYQKVLNSGVFINFDKKFATGSMLGAKTKYTLEFLANMDEKTFITMNPKVKPIYSMIGKLLKGDEYATNKTVVQDIERAMYASFANLALLDTPYEINSNTIKELFKPGQGLVERINSAKIDSKYADNRLIQAFEPYLETEIEFSEEGLVLRKQELFGITLDNFVRKPDAVLEDLNDAWQELLDSPDPEVQKLGRDLIKYAIVTSGLAKNRHSIFEFMPIEVADYLDRGMQKLKDTGMNVVFNRFMEDFLRHNQNENYRKKINFNKLTANNSKTVSTDSVEKLFNLSNLDRRVKFVSKKKLFKTASAEAIRDADIEMNMLRQYKLVQLDNVFYDYYGDIKGTTEADDIMILVPTYVLGKSVGNARIYEYTGNESAFVSNKPNDYQNIKATVDLLKQVTVVEPHTFDFGSVMSYYGKNVEVINYSGEEAKKELISRGIIKENKC